MDTFGNLRPGTTWYMAGLRWLGELARSAAQWFDAPGPDPMPRHTSCEEILADLRNHGHR